MILDQLDIFLNQLIFFLIIHIIVYSSHICKNDIFNVLKKIIDRKKHHNAIDPQIKLQPCAGVQRGSCDSE